MFKRALTVGSLLPNIKKVPPVKVEHAQPVSVKVSTKKPISHKLVFTQHNKRYYIQPKIGQTILDTVLERGQQIDYKCRKGTCGKCTIMIIEGAPSLTPANEKEQNKLGSKVQDGYRLACQSMIH